MRITHPARRASFALQREVFFIAATISAHASAIDEGFRQRDVRFLIELATNWVDSQLYQNSALIKNVQIARYLDYLCAQGYARRIARRAQPMYRLTRVGLIELSRRLALPTSALSEGEFLFAHYFLSNYRERVLALVKREGAEFPFSLAQELEANFDVRAFLRREIERIEREIDRLDSRIKASQCIAQLVADGLRSRRPFADISREVQRLYPYELNSQRPLSEFMADIEPEVARWELGQGTTARINHLWQPLRAMRAEYLKHLKLLLKSHLGR